MLRLLLLMTLSVMSSLAFAEGVPMLFEPAEKDVWNLARDAESRVALTFGEFQTPFSTGSRRR